MEFSSGVQVDPTIVSETEQNGAAEHGGYAASQGEKAVGERHICLLGAQLSLLVTISQGFFPVQLFFSFSP